MLEAIRNDDSVDVSHYPDSCIMGPYVLHGVEGEGTNVFVLFCER